MAQVHWELFLDESGWPSHSKYLAGQLVCAPMGGRGTGRAASQLSRLVPLGRAGAGPSPAQVDVNEDLHLGPADLRTSFAGDLVYSYWQVRFDDFFKNEYL